MHRIPVIIGFLVVDSGIGVLGIGVVVGDRAVYQCGRQGGFGRKPLLGLGDSGCYAAGMIGSPGPR